MNKPSHIFSVERIETPTGRMLVVLDDQNRLRALDWEDHEERMRRLMGRQYGADAIRLNEVTAASAAVHAVRSYFEGDLSAVVGLASATNGTAFQRSVWDALLLIPVGQTLGYAALAARIGKPRAARAVGLANGSNPIAIVVPCHRVIGANGTMTGYGGGVERKRWLLAHEGRNLQLPL